MQFMGRHPPMSEKTGDTENVSAPWGAEVRMDGGGSVGGSDD